LYLGITLFKLVHEYENIRMITLEHDIIKQMYVVIRCSITHLLIAKNRYLLRLDSDTIKTFWEIIQKDYLSGLRISLQA